MRSTGFEYIIEICSSLQLEHLKIITGAKRTRKDLATAGAQVTIEKKQAFTGLLDGTGEYTLVYEDNEGDRMLVGDVPWELQRLAIHLGCAKVVDMFY